MKQYFGILVILFLFQINTFAQDERPKVGLVLSGGGAKGFAHVGVLEVIDSLGIPVDMVAGTSMGSILGGLYAIGYTPDMLHKLITGTNWAEINSSEPGRLYKSFEDRQREDKYLLGITMENGKFQVPGGLINGQKIHAKLNELTRGYHDQQDFSKLPRAFVCIATDLNSGKEYIFNSGSLPNAMRASMSIPSVYMPYWFDNKWLIDGGVVNNFPSDKLKSMGADIIIGVDVQTTFADTVSTPTVAKIIEKTSMYLNYKTSRKRENLCDLVIKPEMQGITISSFNQNEYTIRKGKEAAIKSLDALLELKKRLDPYTVNKVNVYKGLPDSIIIEKISIIGLNNVDDATVKGLFLVNEGDWVKPSFLEHRLSFAYGSGFFDYIQYHLLPFNSHTYELQIQVVENPGAAQINLGFNYDSDYGVGILASLSKRNFLIKGTQASIDCVIGETPRIKFDYYHHHWGFSHSAYLTTYEFYTNRMFEGNVDNNNFTSSIYWKSVFKNNNSYGFAIEHNFAIMDFNDVPVLRSLNGSETSKRLSLKYTHFNLRLFSEGDKLDRVNFPERGFIYLASLRLHCPIYWPDMNTSANPFVMFHGRYKVIIPIIKGFSIQPEFKTVLNLWNKPTIPYSVTVGGQGQKYFNYQLPFSGFRYQELGSLLDKKQNEGDFFQSNASILSMAFQMKLWRKLYAGTILEAAILGNTLEEMGGFNDRYFGYGLKLGLQSVVGPLEISFHQSISHSQPLFYINLGFYY